MSSSSSFSRWRPHPWHGLETGIEPPGLVNAFIEMTPFDLVKVEVDKVSGYLHVDRPQHTSAQLPTLYGFIPRTYCGGRVGSLSPKASGKGDGDPLDICVISERPITHAEVVLSVRVVGGLQGIDHGLADDKIIAVLANDLIWRGVKDVDELPKILIDRLYHYFSTYKLTAGKKSQMKIEKVYGCEAAKKVVVAAMQDYKELFSRENKK